MKWSRLATNKAVFTPCLWIDRNQSRLVINFINPGAVVGVYFDTVYNLISDINTTSFVMKFIFQRVRNGSRSSRHLFF